MNENELRMKTWRELKKIFGFTPKLDGLVSMISGKLVIDILKLDRILSGKDPEYDHILCTYKGKKVSCSEYIKEKFGKEVLDKVIILL
jgi:hypothetical protein